MEKIKANMKSEKSMTVFALGTAGTAFMILGFFSGMLSAGIIPTILGCGLFGVMMIYLLNSSDSSYEI